ncbi:hypothetical protein [Cupriavidus oxalaticus]|uniref:Uncharacterized protein n=1 Tax=Cupriavidus oxalaticus TaxID=96344 RepID=A0A4P7LU56_9BURK|nr:hypothetical protein [Cupriavidus oxalaticus]QBY56001.1 hypothetical protein E0W60_33635 [Cupriavidus oxalaticus]
MLPPRSVHLYSSPNGDLVGEISTTTPVDKYIGAMRILQARTGKAPRSALENTFPLVLTSDDAILSTARTSGIPHGQRLEHEPVVQNYREQILFLQRGDLVMSQVENEDGYRRLHIGVTFDVTPRILLSPDPITMLSPWTQPIADADAVQLVEMALQRELTQAEQFFAAVAMPHTWQRCGGGPVAAVSNPGREEAEQCRVFAALFTQPSEKLRQLAAIAPAWEVALASEVQFSPASGPRPAKLRM